jgi:hypothetical protein
MVALAITFRRLTGKRPLSRLTYIVLKVGRGSRRLDSNGGRGDVRPVRFTRVLASLYQGERRDFLLFVVVLLEGKLHAAY